MKLRAFKRGSVALSVAVVPQRAVTGMRDVFSKGAERAWGDYEGGSLRPREGGSPWTGTARSLPIRRGRKRQAYRPYKGSGLLNVSEEECCHGNSRSGRIQSSKTHGVFQIEGKEELRRHPSRSLLMGALATSAQAQNIAARIKTARGHGRWVYRYCGSKYFPARTEVKDTATAKVQYVFRP